MGVPLLYRLSFQRSGFELGTGAGIDASGDRIRRNVFNQ